MISSKKHSFKSVEQLIGNTPLLKLNSFSRDNLKIYAKLEGQNPGGSIKDRVALALLDDLCQKHPEIKKKVIIEPSSGNTAIGLAMIGAKRGLKIKIILPQNSSQERIKTLQFWGAEIEFCKPSQWQGSQVIEKIKRLCQENPSFVMPNQYENPASVQVHYQKTAKEIIRDCPQLTHLVSTIGTGGTITGIAKRLKEYQPEIKIIGVEVGINSKIPGPRSLEKYQPPILDLGLIDERIKIKKEKEQEVFTLQKMLCQKEGIFYGCSSAAALWGALNSNLIKKEISNSNPLKIVVIFPDRGERYLSIL